MNQNEEPLKELNEAKKSVTEAKKLLDSGDFDQQKAALALVFLIRESILSVLEEHNDECTEALYGECLDDTDDLTYMVHDLVQYEYTASAQFMIRRYKRIVDALIVYFTHGEEAFGRIDDTIEESNEDGPEDPIGFINLGHSASVLQELIMDFYSLRTKLKDTIIVDPILRRSLAIDIVALRESLWKIITEVCEERCEDDGEDDMISIFCQEMGADQTHIAGIIADFENEGKSATGLLLIEKMIDMTKRFMNFCKTDKEESLHGDFISLDSIGTENEVE